MLAEQFLFAWNLTLSRRLAITAESVVQREAVNPVPEIGLRRSQMVKQNLAQRRIPGHRQRFESAVHGSLPFFINSRSIFRQQCELAFTAYRPCCSLTG